MGSVQQYLGYGRESDLRVWSGSAADAAQTRERGRHHVERRGGRWLRPVGQLRGRKANPVVFGSVFAAGSRQSEAWHPLRGARAEANRQRDRTWQQRGE